jgi:hypothetical protein
MADMPMPKWTDDLLSTRNLVIAFAIIEAIGIIAILTIA